MTTKEKLVGAELMMPPGTLSFPNLFVPKKAPKSDVEKFSASVIWTPEAVALPEFRAVKQEAARLMAGKYGDVWTAAVKAGQLFWPFKKIEGLLVKPGYPEGGVLINFSCAKDSPPYLFDRYKDPVTGKAAVITDPKRLYAGAQVVVLVRPYLFDVDVKKGVTLGLQAVQWWADGDRLDGRSNPIEKFAAEDAPAAGMPGAPAAAADPLAAMLGDGAGNDLP